MNINTKSWHYKFYKFTYKFWDTCVPRQTSLCQYVRRIVFMPLLMLLFLVICLVALIFIYACQLIIAPFALIVGYRPILPFIEDMSNDIAVPYNGLKIKGISFRLYPWHVLLPVGLAYAFYAWVNFSGWFLPLMICIPIILMIGIIVIWLWLTESESESVRLFKASWSAKTSKICPLVTFDDKPTSTDVNE